MAKILVVEDDSFVLEAIADALISQHHIVEGIRDGAEAAKRLKKDCFDLLILDVELPHVSGYDLCAAYRRTGGNCPIIMVTGRDTIEDLVSGLDFGADDYLAKPFNLRELLARVRNLLRRAS